MQRGCHKMMGLFADLALFATQWHRTSVHYFNTEDEVDRFVAAVGAR